MTWKNTAIIQVPDTLWEKNGKISKFNRKCKKFKCSKQVICFTTHSTELGRTYTPGGVWTRISGYRIPVCFQLSHPHLLLSSLLYSCRLGFSWPPYVVLEGANVGLLWTDIADVILMHCFWKWLFQPAFGVRSTQTLVEIYNRVHINKLSIYPNR